MNLDAAANQAQCLFSMPDDIRSREGKKNKKRKKDRRRLRWDKRIGFYQKRITKKKKAPATVRPPQYYEYTHTLERTHT